MASFKKLGTDNWQVSFYCKDFVGNNKKYKKSGFRTKSLANEYANDFIAKMNGSSEVMLFTVIDEFIEYSKTKLRFGSIKNYNHIKKALHKDAVNISINKIDTKYIVNLLEKYTDIPSKRNYAKAFLKLVLDYAMIHYGLKINVLTNFKIAKSNVEKEHKIKREIWTLEEFNEFIKRLKEHHSPRSKTSKYILIYNILYFTGMRVGELSGLYLEDIDLENKVISIKRTRIANGQSNPPKTSNSLRDIPIHSNLVDMLKEYIKGIPNIKNTFIFPTISTLISVFRYHTSLTTMVHIKLHGFRHSHVSFLITKGVDITTISKRLGHANPNITLSIYSHFYKKKDDVVVSILEDI